MSETLYEKIAKTIPGKWSLFLRELHYNHSHEFSTNKAHMLLDCANYLEGLAFVEIEKDIPPWVEEFRKRKNATEVQT